MNFVYGCVVRICLSGGFCRRAIFSRSIVVQLGSGVCARKWSHALIAGLSVVMSAYSIRGGGWCWFW